MLSQVLFVLEKSCNFAVFIDVNTLCRGNLWQTGHRENVAREDYYKSCACGNFDVFNGYCEVFGCAEFCRVVRKTVLCFGDTNRATSETEVFELLNLFFLPRA